MSNPTYTQIQSKYIPVNGANSSTVILDSDPIQNNTIILLGTAEGSISDISITQEGVVWIVDQKAHSAATNTTSFICRGRVTGDTPSNRISITLNSEITLWQVEALEYNGISLYSPLNTISETSDWFFSSMMEEPYQICFIISSSSISLRTLSYSNLITSLRTEVSDTLYFQSYFYENTDEPFALNIMKSNPMDNQSEMLAIVYSGTFVSGEISTDSLLIGTPFKEGEGSVNADSALTSTIEIKLVKSLIDIDILQTIYSSTSEESIVGINSKYKNVEHPATNKKISGWLWGERAWILPGEENSYSNVPSIWDPTKGLLKDEDFVSGIGDNNDLKLETIDVINGDKSKQWNPRLNHGYFYINDEEWYLFSDDYRSEIISTSNTEDGLQYHELTFQPKPGIPICIKQYEWEPLVGKYKIAQQLRKRIQFSGIVVSGEELPTINDEGSLIIENIDNSNNAEFIVESGYQRIRLNSTYTTEVGNEENFENLEVIGTSDGRTNQFHTQYSPIDLTQPFELYTLALNSVIPEQWQKIDFESDFTNGKTFEYKVDDILGLIIFGDYTPENINGSGAIPMAGARIGIKYTKSYLIEYEPNNSRDDATFKSANLNPLCNLTADGFLQIASEASDGFSISLNAELEQEDSNYLITASNETGTFVAKVVDSNGEPVEGHLVTFKLDDNTQFGHFTNLESSINAITDINGEAKVRYCPPTSFSQLEHLITHFKLASAESVFLYVENMVASSKEEIFLYKVMSSDPVLGLSADQKQNFYSDFLADEEVVINPNGISTITETTSYEQDRRIRTGLSIPTILEDTEKHIGQKILMVTAGQAISPVTGLEISDAIIPLYPISFENVGSSNHPLMRLEYPLDILNSSDSKALVVIAPLTLKVYAETYSTKLSKTLRSPALQIKINIPNEASGMFICDTLNEIDAQLIKKVKNINEFTEEEIMQFASVESVMKEYNDAHGFIESGMIILGEDFEPWFRKVYKGNSTLLGLLSLIASGEDYPFKIPLGWRLQSTGITVASMLDRITFVQPNINLPADYWDD